MKKFKFTINGTDYETEILSVEDQNIKIEINGTPFDVLVHKDKKESKTPTLVRSAAPEPKKNIEKRSGGSRIQIKSPLPGIVTKIYVAVGDTVMKNQKLYCLEAMKMENDIKSEREGRVVAVNIATGQAVLQEEIVMELD